MTNELLVTKILDVIEIFFDLIDYINKNYIIIFLNIVILIMFIYVIVRWYVKYKRISNSYEFIKFLFFGSVYNKFNFFPKLKLFMDYKGSLNIFDIETVDFKCISDNSNRESNITWTLKDVYNKTNKIIDCFYFYTTSDKGTVNDAEVKIKPENEYVKININETERVGKTQFTTFSFNKPIKPNTHISEIKLNMKMKDAFDFSQKEVVHVYPRNFGRKVKHINISFKTIGADELSVVLHEIKKEGKTYIDKSIQSVGKSKDSDIEGINIYNCSINDDEINVENLYYLLINPLTVTTEQQTEGTSIVEVNRNEN